MAELLKDGSIRMKDGRILWGRDQFQIIDFVELSQLLTPAPRPSGGFAGFGGGKGSKGDRGPQGIQGPPGIISLIQSEGFNLPLQNTLNFLGESVSVVDDPGNGRLNITIDDLYAATRIVSSDPTQGTDLTIQDAIDNLPAEGGTIFVKQGTYVISTTILLPNKPINIIGTGWGTILSMPVFVGPMFKVEDGLTEARWYGLRDIQLQGGSVVGQEFWQFDDASGFGNCIAPGLRVTGFETIVNWEQYNELYQRQSVFIFRDSFCEPISGGSILMKTPHPAGSFFAAAAVKLENSDFTFSGAYPNGIGFTADADCDLWLNGCKFFYMQRGTSINGIYCVATDLTVWNGTGDITIFGNAWDVDDFFSEGCFISDFGFAGPAPGACVFIYDGFGGLTNKASSCSDLGWRILHGRSEFSILQFADSVGMTNPAIEVRQTAGTGFRHHRIHDMEFRRAGSPLTVFPNGCIKIVDSTYVHIHAVHFFSTITGKTIEETGSSDFNLGVGNSGLSNGTGMTIIGAGSKFVIGDYNLA